MANWTLNAILTSLMGGAPLPPTPDTACTLEDVIRLTRAAGVMPNFTGVCDLEEVLQELIHPTPGYGVALMLHMNGVDGSTIFTDSSVNAFVMTQSGSTQIDTAQKKFGSASGMGGGLGYISTPAHDNLKFGSGNFTVDFWVRFESLPTYGGGSPHNHPFCIFAQNLTTTPGDGGNILSLQIDGAYQLKWIFRCTGTDLIITWNTTVLIDTWYHIALVRSGNNWYLFQDGVVLTVTSSGGTTLAIQDWTGTLSLFEYKGIGWYHHGWIDELRMTKSIAWWTSDFTPPTGEYS